MALDLQQYAKLATQAAAEGAVLLRNEGRALPLKKGDKVAVFGRCQFDYYRSGTGSGGAVRVAYSTNLYKGLKRYGELVLDEALADTYRAWMKENPFDHGGGGWAAEPWNQKDMPLEASLVKEVRARSDKAIYVIGRTAGEDKDNGATEGSFLLTAQERENLKAITEIFADVVVVMNVSNIVDMSFLKEDTKGHIKSVLYVWQGGMEGGYAAADVLAGRVTPSGKLTDTIAASYGLYPSSANYGDEDENVYQEDIYVGYRYFETFAKEAVDYAFGYGLSYTTFSIEITKAVCIGDGIDAVVDLMVSVKNTGDVYCGKEVVQVYVEAPQGRLGRPARELVAFAKTEELKPGEEDVLPISFPVSAMAAYDDSGCTGYKSCYVLESGAYHVYVGNSVRDTQEVFLNGAGTYVIPRTAVVKELEEAMAPVKRFTRMKPGVKKADGNYEITYEAVPVRSIDLRERILQRLPAELPITGNRNYTLQQVAAKEVSMEDFIAQLSKEDLAAMVRGEGMGHPAVTQGTAAAFGGVSDQLGEYGIPLACAADGPSGIRMEGGNFARQLPIGTLLACTWNTKMVKGLYALAGLEMVENQIDTLLGPGMNIHRDPLNGRNFEYFSEDPLVTGAMAAAVAKGINEGGAHATVKHFACNSQEKRRSFVDSVVSERAIREIYIKGFEQAVKEGGVSSVMTAYNPVNGHHAASNYDLCTTILRNEWGYTGIVMTDWWAKMNDTAVSGKGACVRQTGAMIRSQNDLYMVVNNYGAEINANGDDIPESLEKGTLTVGELQRAAINICRFLIKTESFKRVGKEAKKIPEIEPLTDASAAGAAKVVEIAEHPVAEAEMEKELYIHIAEEGVYSLLASISSSDTNMSQTAGEILLNGEQAAFIQTQGTENAQIVQKLQKCKLKPGIYRVLPRVIKPHMEIRQITFKLCR